ncbi:hypothetical protein [Aurantimonas sp. Leaf443]|uniref:hypothetical protein n=1 Tax=Aurantimonas sp. Leaf443 TaxID=1736378 RepID=UPI000A7BC221|nr:hypothetical protein [Aurantimonas sp. Leaf443]
MDRRSLKILVWVIAPAIAWSSLAYTARHPIKQAAFEVKHVIKSIRNDLRGDVRLG